jgi:hypothetical protein
VSGRDAEIAENESLEVLARLQRLERAMTALLAQVDGTGTRPEALLRALEACRALAPDPIAIRRAVEGLGGGERPSMERLLRRLIDLNAVTSDAVSRAKAVAQAEIVKTRALQDRLAHLAGPESSGVAFDAVS